ncbi:MAG TPA: NADP-dependent oxidoreductase [Solirubrobacterales bacterium]|nr:NADP-dependent oxidoreductase [Solirubrobacterales bacterium]
MATPPVEPETMRAVLMREFGEPEVLAVERVAVPQPILTEIQVRVEVAGVNPVDFKTRKGRGMAPVLGELPFVLGWDVAGVVTEVAPGVTRFAVGDEVFGMPWFPRQAGAYAEYVTAPSRHFAAKPHGLSTEEAGALPLAALTAWQVVVDTARVQEGDDVLIHGAAGGVGHLAVQIARARGANVTATARREQAEWLGELGAERVIDYREENFAALCSGLDAVVDCHGSQGEASLEVLRPGGLLVSVPSRTPPELIETAKRRNLRATGFLVEPDPVGLAGITALVEAGRLRVHVDEAFELERAAEAHHLAESSHGGGKIVLRV